MKKSTRRILAFLAAATMALSLTACGGEDLSAYDDYSGEGKAFTEKTVIDVVVGNHSSWPFREDWKVWEYIQEGSGATLNITAIPNENIETKFSLMMSNPAELPDLLHTWDKSQVERYALSGAYLSYTDNMDKMPNMEAFFNTLPEIEREELFMQRTSGDGKMYSAPSYGTQTVSGIRTWMYRKDIFDKHGLKTPTTAEELYQVCKKLKELYPESYPLCVRGGIFRLEDWGPAWQKDFSFQQYYDYDQQKWIYGAQEPVCKEMIEYFNKFREEGLVSPDFTDIPDKSWEELMSTDRGFITSDYIVRIDFFNNACRLENPEYTLTAMAPPAGPTATGKQKAIRSALNMYGYCVVNSGDEKAQDNAFKLVDWMYTDEAAELLGWGVEGETYKVNDEGKKEFILGEGEDPQTIYGFGLYGGFQRMATEAYEALYSEEQIEACHFALPYMEDHVNPHMWLGFTGEAEKEVDDLHQELFTYTREQISKFLLGQLPMSEWDTFQKGLKDMGVDRLLELYTESYNGVIGKN